MKMPRFYSITLDEYRDLEEGDIIRVSPLIYGQPVDTIMVDLIECITTDPDGNTQVMATCSDQTGWPIIATIWMRGGKPVQ